MDWQAMLNTVVNWATTAGLKLLVALVLLFISFKIINLLSRRIAKAAERKHADKTISRTAAYVVRIGLKIVVLVCLIGYVGIDTGGLTALIASLGVGLGLAVNGALSNLAGGVLILLTRPFRIDDYIEAQGFGGTVEEIHITNTKLRTADNKIIYIPNGSLSSGTIVNYSSQETRRVDEVFSISYNADFKRAIAIIEELCANHPLVLKDPKPFARITEHADSSLNITMRVFVKSADYWTVKFDMLEAVKERFDREGIEIPYNRLDVQIRND